MNPTTIQMISAAHGTQMREQAAASRRALEARRARPAYTAGHPLALIARHALSLAAPKRLPGRTASA